MAKRSSGIRLVKIAPLDEKVLSHGDLYVGEWLERFGMTPAGLSRSTGMNEGYISSLISGKHDPNPTLKALRKLGRGIGIPVWALFLPPNEAGLQRQLIQFIGTLASRKPK